MSRSALSYENPVEVNARFSENSEDIEKSASSAESVPAPVLSQPFERSRLSGFAGWACSALLVLGLPAGLAHARDCTEVSRTCVDTKDRVIDGVTVHRDCWRWEKKFRCTQASPEANRCDAAHVPASCTITKTTCTKQSSTGECPAVEAQLRCTTKPSGPGITAGKIEVSIAYETKTGAPVPIEKVEKTENVGADGFERLLRNERSESGLGLPSSSSPSTSSKASSSDDGCRVTSERCIDSETHNAVG